MCVPSGSPPGQRRRDFASPISSSRERERGRACPPAPLRRLSRAFMINDFTPEQKKIARSKAILPKDNGINCLLVLCVCVFLSSKTQSSLRKKILPQLYVLLPFVSTHFGWWCVCVNKPMAASCAIKCMAVSLCRGNEWVGVRTFSHLGSSNSPHAYPLIEVDVF